MYNAFKYVIGGFFWLVFISGFIILHNFAPNSTNNDHWMWGIFTGIYIMMAIDFIMILFATRRIKK